MNEPIRTKKSAWLEALLSWGFWLRTAAFAVVAYIVFGVLLHPMHIRGPGMEPTYARDSLNFCWRGRYLFSRPKPFQVVSVRLPGARFALVRRVVASEGNTVGFYRGKLIVNGQPVDEPYVTSPCDWTMRPIRVAEGHVFVAGDNRSMPIQEAMIGEVPVKHVLGSTLW